MQAYYDWRTNSYKMAPDYKSAGLIQSMFGGGVQSVAPAGMGGWMQSAAPSVDMNAAASSMPVQLMQKFVNSRGWGAPINTSGMSDWRGNAQNDDAQKWAAMAVVLGRR